MDGSEKRDDPMRSMRIAQAMDRVVPEEEANADPKMAEVSRYLDEVAHRLVDELGVDGIHLSAVIKTDVREVEGNEYQAVNVCDRMLAKDESFEPEEFLYVLSQAFRASVKKQAVEMGWLDGEGGSGAVN